MKGYRLGKGMVALQGALIWTCIAWCAQTKSDERSAANFWARPEGGSFTLRILCWNVGLDSIHRQEHSRSASFERIVRAVSPDVLCLQEMGPGRGEDLKRLMDRYLPLGEGLSWHVHTASDNAIVSKFPFRFREQELVVKFPLPGLPDFHYGQAMCLVDIPDEACPRDFFLIALHNKSRGGESNVQMRQRQSDSIVRWIRDVRQTGRPRAIPERTPMVILGDLNVLEVEPADPAHHLTTLLTGNIWDEKEFGPDFVLDYDDTNLIEVKPHHNAREKEFYTWREDGSPFPPGALDRVLYTDSVLQSPHSFVLNTTLMTDEELAETGVLKSDVLWEGEAGNYDHLPLVVDFAVVADE